MKKEKAQKKLDHLIAKYPVMEEVMKERYSQQVSETKKKAAEPVKAKAPKPVKKAQPKKKTTTKAKSK